ATSGATTKTVDLGGTAFEPGAWTVSCTATDTHGKSASGSFPLLVTKQGGPTITPPTLTTPSGATPQATGPTGATVSFTVTAANAISGPTCTAPLGAGGAPATLGSAGSIFSGAFPIGTTEVTCSASNGLPQQPLTVKRSFPVTVE